MISHRHEEFASPDDGADGQSRPSRRWVIAASLFWPASQMIGPARAREHRARLAWRYWRRMYAALPNEAFPVPAVDLSKIETRNLRQVVDYATAEWPGTIVVDAPDRFLYLVLEGGRALRYGIGVGRQGFSWSGRASIPFKRSWPKWTPPASMIEREPKLAKYRNGMEPGLDNPLGARALYLFQNGRDTLYRIHGTNEVSSIGKAVSSGCIRLLNQDVIDLYRRVTLGTEVVVRQGFRWPGLEAAGGREPDAR